ncbi:hypothetical protein ALP36_04518 [Pseudomonas syringae pv. coriandricola]|uniref:Uncharacterized protein n=1 Tax=Pseudomonas syringae pv. coriandricola TaxID=264453 RepID=A0A3M4TV69_9PSED|nr:MULTISPECIES: hypothetical protein [Pseudomonas syringae group]RMR31170.1 hypothetical protein ALP87_00956 [Pseudomonas syringae pv. coriandricola]RMU04726.1 hypothetical protein ALP36_04518 [Pseudomonas syringae pv. coriandricola]SDW37129.1 hypothetical protein SAMN05444514_10390 [Pseudomonas syringae]SFL65629.1 hypothetical protein SAMN05444064_10390 [Pseudomonas syringae]
MSGLAALRRDVHALTRSTALIVAIIPLAGFALGLIVVFPQSF